MCVWPKWLYVSLSRWLIILADALKFYFFGHRTKVDPFPNWSFISQNLMTMCTFSTTLLKLKIKIHFEWSLFKVQSAVIQRTIYVVNSTLAHPIIEGTRRLSPSAIHRTPAQICSTSEVYRCLAYSQNSTVELGRLVIEALRSRKRASRSRVSAPRLVVAYYALLTLFWKNTSRPGSKSIDVPWLGQWIQKHAYFIMFGRLAKG